MSSRVNVTKVQKLTAPEDLTTRRKLARQRQSAHGERVGSFGLDESARALLARRDERSLQHFFDASHSALYSFVARMLGDTHLAEDLTQEAYMRILRALPNYESERPLRPWVFAIVANLVRDHLRGKQREQDVVEFDDGTGPHAEPATDAPGPLAALTSEERARYTTAAIAALPERLRSVLVLRHYEELPFAEIGASMSITEAAARQRFARALNELRTNLARALGAPEGTT